MHGLITEVGNQAINQLLISRPEEDMYDSCEFDHQVALYSFSTWFFTSKHEIHHQISGRLKVLCGIFYVIIMHI